MLVSKCHDLCMGRVCIGKCLELDWLQIEITDGVGLHLTAPIHGNDIFLLCLQCFLNVSHTSHKS